MPPTSLNVVAMCLSIRVDVYKRQMLKCHSELFKSSVKLADGLRLSTKEELKDVAQLLLLPIPSKLRKEEYVSCLAEAVLTCPDILIPQLTHDEWLLLQKLVKAGANTYVEEPNMIMTSTLELLSFVATDRGLNGDKIRYMICDELREAVAPHIDKFLTSTEENSRFVLEQYALGILNLYGLLPYTEFLKQLTGYLKGSMTKDEIAKGLSNSMLMRQLTIDIEDIYNSVMYCLLYTSQSISIQQGYITLLNTAIDELFLQVLMNFLSFGDK